MAQAITYYLLNTKALGSNFQELQEMGTAPTAANSTTGWTVGTSATTTYSPQKTNTKQLATTFTATVHPNGTLDNANGDGWRTSGALTGTFPAGNWVFTWKLRSATAAASGTMRVRVRVYRAASNVGATPTEITSAVQIGSTVGPLTTTADVTCTVTWAAPLITLTNEYLIFEIALEVVTASASTTADALFRTGSTIVTTAFDGIVLRGTANTAAGSGSTFLVTLPTNSAGDVLVVALDSDNANGNMTGPAGWNLWAHGNGGASSSDSWLWYKVSSGSESNPTFTVAVSGGLSASAGAFIGVSNITPVDANTASAAANAATVVLPTFNTTVAGAKVIACITSFSTGAIAPSTAGTRLLASVIVLTDVGLGDYQMGAAGATPALTWTVPSGANSVAGGALRPATADTPTTFPVPESMVAVFVGNYPHLRM